MDNLFQLLKDHFPFSANGDKYPEATYQSAGLLIPQFNRLVNRMSDHQLKHRTVREFSSPSAEKLLEILEANGSDKGNRHHYYQVYNFIFEKLGLESNLRLLEVGLGTNNPSLISTMGQHGVPGASIRAFRDFLPNAMVYGADVDKDILFTEDRIQTGYVDQLDAASFASLDFGEDNFDLIIDDGLHSVGANFNTLLFAMDRVNAGGWIVIEDIPAQVHPFWESVDFVIRSSGEFDSCMVRCRKAFLYVLHRKPESPI